MLADEALALRDRRWSTRSRRGRSVESLARRIASSIDVTRKTDGHRTEELLAVRRRIAAGCRRARWARSSCPGREVGRRRSAMRAPAATRRVDLRFEIGDEIRRAPAVRRRSPRPSDRRPAARSSPRRTASRNSSATASATMKRLAAMQDCPLLIVRALTAVAAAFAMSALGMTMNGSLPPSSSTVFLSARPARAATSCAGAFAAGQRHRADARIVEERRHVGRTNQERLEHAVGKAGAAEDVLDGERALRHVRRVLEEADVAGHQRRRGEAEHLPEREVPRHDREHDAERLVADVARLAPRCGRRSSARKRAPCSA